MAIPYNIPSLDIIKSFTKPEEFENWLPGLFGKNYYNGVFPINSKEDTITEETLFSKKTAPSNDDFNISLKRYFLFLYCLKAKPYLFDAASKIINYNIDEYLFRPELAEYLEQVQTNQIRNKINSSLTIELVKKYSLDKGLNLETKQLSDYFKVAESEDFKNSLSRKLNVVLYESVVKHTLYNSLKESYSFPYKEDSASGWINKAINLELGELSYFIDMEGGPDNKSFPVVCVLTKKINIEEKENVLLQTNKFLSNVFGRDVTDNCLANIIGEPDQFENNFKKVPILKGKKSNSSFYNAICVVYDFTKILLSQAKNREFKAQTVAEAGLGFLTKYTLELNSIDNLIERKNVISDMFDKYFPSDSFSKTKYQIANRKRHATEIYSRINLLSQDEIKKSLEPEIKINTLQLKTAYSDYVDSIISTYKRKRSTNIQTSQYSKKDEKVTLHFDSSLNLLAITCVPQQINDRATISYYSPFIINTGVSVIPSITFDLTVNQEVNLSDKFFGSYSQNPNGKFKEYSNNLKKFIGYRICFMTKTLERMLYDNFEGGKNHIAQYDNLSSGPNYHASFDISSRLYESLGEIFYIEDYFNKDGKFIDKTIEIASLSTNYTETKYQSLSLQTLAFYLINCYEGEKIFDKSPDVKVFGEQFHYPVLACLPSKEEDDTSNILVSLNLSDNQIYQEVLIIDNLAKKTLANLKDTLQFDTTKVVNTIMVSNAACFADVILVLEDLLLEILDFDPVTNSFAGFAEHDIGQELGNKLLKITDRIPILDIIRSLVESLINQLLSLEVSNDPCKPLPKRIGFDVNDLSTPIEYLKDIYYDAYILGTDIRGFVKEIPKSPELDMWKFIYGFIINALVKLIVRFVLAKLVNLIRPSLEKICNLDFDFIKLLNLEPSPKQLEFFPSAVPDSFGNIADAGGALYDVQITIDINVLIDLSEIATRDFVYNKFAEEFIIPKTSDSIKEIEGFLSQISPSMDLYELASLLRGFGTDYTIQTVADAISLLDISFKDTFSNRDGVIKLFQFLSNYCDYNICYNILANSLEKFTGNICSPQPSKKKDYETIIKNIGEDPTKVIRDQVLSLEKELDDLCSIDFELAIDVLKDGPKVLASSLNQYMVMPLNTIVNYQKNIYNFELGFDQDGNEFNADQKKSLGDAYYYGGFQSSKVKNEVYNEFKNSLKSINISTPKIEPLTISLNPDEKNFFGSTYYDFVKLTDITKDALKDEVEKRQQYFKNIGLDIQEDLVYSDLINKKYVIPYRSSYNIYSTIVNKGNTIFEKLYKNIVYFTDAQGQKVSDNSYMDKLIDEVNSSLEQATNADVDDNLEIFYSYIDRILLINGKKTK